MGIRVGLVVISGEVECVKYKYLQAISAKMRQNENDKGKRRSKAASEDTTAAAFDARIIPEYDGKEDVVEWYSRAEMLCELRGVPLASILPLRLTGGAFAVWSQLPAGQRCSAEVVRDALYAAFALDEHAAYEAFTSRRLQSGESADVFLADLRRLATLFGGMSERGLTCAFVAGLPDAVRHTIRAGSRAEALELTSVLVRARAVLSEERTAAGAGATRREARMSDRRQHGQPRQARRCWTCHRPGHFAASCPDRVSENGPGGSASAPAPSPAW